MNVQYVWETNTERFPKQRGVEGTYKIFTQILSGFEIAPNLSVDSLKTSIDIKIGNIAMQKEKGMVTEAVVGRFPKWNQIIIRDVKLDKNLQFASDLRVTVHNTTKTMILRMEA